MTDRLTNVEYLLMLAEDARAQGDDITTEINRQGEAHARKVLALLGMIKKAEQILNEELRRFNHYLPEGSRPQAIRGTVSQTPSKVG